jgi:hypothetical protein
VGEKRSVRALNRATLARQGLLERYRGSVAEVVGRLAGLQAQHANPPYVALWSRRVDQTIDALEAALEDRSVVKATLMRSTLHIVAATDYPAFDAATAEPRTANWRATARRAGVDLDDLHGRLLRYVSEPRAVADLDAWVARTAPGLHAAAPSGVQKSGLRAASAGGGLVHVPPSGSWRSPDRPSYVAARSWLRGSSMPSADDGLRIAIERYLTAYGPASVADIAKWLGHPRSPRVKAAIDALGDGIVRSIGHDGRELVDLEELSMPPEDAAAAPRFLSRWDSVLIGYDQRERILPKRTVKAVAKANGDFLPTFLVDGFVAGLWSIDVTKGAAVLRLEPFEKVSPADRRGLEDEGERLVRFHEPDATRHEVQWRS